MRRVCPILGQVRELLLFRVSHGNRENQAARDDGEGILEGGRICWQRGIEPLTMMFFLRAFSPRVLRRDRTDEQKFSKSSN